MTETLTALYFFLTNTLPAEFSVELGTYSVLITGDDKGRVREAKRIAARFLKLSTGVKGRHARNAGARTWRNMETGAYTAGVALAPTDECKCDRCGGAGRIAAFAYYAGGECFECSGSGFDDFKMGSMT